MTAFPSPSQQPSSRGNGTALFAPVTEVAFQNLRSFVTGFDNSIARTLPSVVNPSTSNSRTVYFRKAIYNNVRIYARARTPRQYAIRVASYLLISACPIHVFSLSLYLSLSCICIMYLSLSESRLTFESNSALLASL